MMCWIEASAFWRVFRHPPGCADALVLLDKLLPPGNPWLWVFALAVVWLGYVYFDYAVLLKILTGFRRVETRSDPDYQPAVSVLISARNEEKDIAWKVSETLRWDYPSERLELLVASDASDDRTDEILKSIHDPRLKFIRLERRCGKGAALNRLAELAAGEILFFTDANTHVGADCLRKLVRHFADPRVGCVTGETVYGREHQPVIESGTGVYLGYESRVKQLESELGSVLACDGAIFSVRRSLYRPVLPDLANDLELPLRIGHAGYRVLLEPEARVMERETSSPWESFKQRRRISAQGMLAFWKLRHTLTGLRGWQFVSRKLLRWLTLIPLLLLLVSTAALAPSPLLAAFLALQGVFYLLALAGFLAALAGRTGSRLIAVPFFILLGSFSTLCGVIDACRGRRFAVWETPALSRGGENRIG